MKMTQRAAVQAVKWAQQRLGLLSWSFEIELCDDPPDWIADDCCQSDYGYTTIAVQHERARIWVSPKRAIKNGSTPLIGVFHEVAHTALKQYGIELPDQDWRWEVFCNRIAEVMAGCYEAERQEATA